ncbi:aKG-HExxH-type peptide beta-hydroxylase [Streptomyces sp. NPDC055239]
MSSAVFAEVASTRPDPRGTTALRAGLHTRRLVLLKALLARIDGTDPAVRRRADRDWNVLEQSERRCPAAVRDVLDYPMTGAWLAESLAAPDGPAFERHLAHLGAVAATAAVRAGCRVTMTVEASAGVLALPGIGVLRCPTGRARLRIRAGLLRAEGTGNPGGALLYVPPGGRRPRGGGRRWNGMRELSDGAVVLDDLDPHRVPRSGVGSDALPAAERRRTPHRPWMERWCGAQRLLAITDPGRGAETRALLRAVVPLGPDARHGVRQPVSATMRSAPGAVLTELPAGAPEMAEVLVHEVHHTKLTVLQELMPLCLPDQGAVYRVGWRPDPRPVASVLQGAYAHLALTDLWRRAGAGAAAPRQWRRRSAERFDAYREQVESALSILLESDELTFEGREFTREMERHHASLGRTARLLE